MKVPHDCRLGSAQIWRLIGSSVESMLDGRRESMIGIVATLVRTLIKTRIEV